MPHWRADDVTYYVTFRHRRPLEDSERELLFRTLLKTGGYQLNMMLVCVLPETTELLTEVRADVSGEPYELSEAIDKAKARAGKAIIKKSGERFPPFFNESYDRIIRDEAELEDKFMAIMSSPEDLGLATDADEYPFLWLNQDGAI